LQDGEWKHDPSAKTETDEHGNINNVISPEDLTNDTSSSAISSVAPGASTLAMAGQEPNVQPSSPPGAFPEFVEPSICS